MPFKIIMTTSVSWLKTVFLNTTPDLQDQDQNHSVQDQDQDHFFSLRPVLSWDWRSQTTSLVSRGAKYTEQENFCDFRLKSPFILETVRDIGPYLLYVER